MLLFNYYLFCFFGPGSFFWLNQGRKKLLQADSVFFHHILDSQTASVILFCPFLYDSLALFGDLITLFDRCLDKSYCLVLKKGNDVPCIVCCDTIDIDNLLSESYIFHDVPPYVLCCHLFLPGR